MLLGEIVQSGEYWVVLSVDDGTDMVGDEFDSVEEAIALLRAAGWAEDEWAVM